MYKIYANLHWTVKIEMTISTPHIIKIIKTLSKREKKNGLGSIYTRGARQDARSNLRVSIRPTTAGLERNSVEEKSIQSARVKLRLLKYTRSLNAHLNSSVDTPSRRF